MSYTLSPQGERFLKNEEGLRLKAYICPAGKLTIGYGHRITPADPQQISQTQANIYFTEDTRRILNELWSEIQTLNQNQVDALVSFIYNIGINAWRSSTAKRDLMEGKVKLVPFEMVRWCHDDHGKVIDGLKTRREKECVVFTGGHVAA